MAQYVSMVAVLLAPVSVEAGGPLGVAESWTTEIVEPALPEPVRVETPGHLWIGCGQADPSDDGAACHVALDLPVEQAHASATGVVLQWTQDGDDTGWANADSPTLRPAVSVTIGYGPTRAGAS